MIIDPIGMETPAADSKPPDVAIERDGLFGFGSWKSRASRAKGAAIDIDPVTKEPAGAGPVPIDPVSEAVRETRSKRDPQHGDAPQIEPADAPRKPPREDGGDTARAEEGAPAEKRKRPVFSMILVAALAIAFVGIGAVWAMVSGILQTPEQRDTSVPNPPAIVESEDFAGGLSVDGAFSSEWIEMFAPRDMESAIPGARAAIERVESAGGGAVRITSADPGLSGEVLFELEPALLRRLDGRPSLIALTARSAGEMPTQITVRCELPGGNGCGRYRFDVAYAAGDIVFRLDEIGDATQPGFLAVNADVTGNGGAIDLYGIRILRQ